MIEDDLRSLRLVAPAGAARNRILTAGQIARKDQCVGRWIRGIAAMSIAIAFAAVLLGTGEGARRSTQAFDPDHRPRFIRYLSQ